MSDDFLLADQADFYGRLLADSVLADVAILAERKGTPESDVEQALEVMNTRSEAAPKRGAVVIVLMPQLEPQSPNLPAPDWTVTVELQVIEHPVLNLGDGGTGLPAETIARRVRQLFHHFANGAGGTYTFAGMEPAPVEPGKVSYVVRFSRKGGDQQLAKAGRPTIAVADTDAGATVTLTTTTPGATILYTIDGTYPRAGAAGTTVYAAPFAAPIDAVVRAVATADALQQSDVAQRTFGAPSAFSAGFNFGFL